MLHASQGLERQRAERQLGELWARVGRRVREESWVLARVMFTLRSDGSEISGNFQTLHPTSSRLSRMVAIYSSVWPMITYRTINPRKRRAVVNVIVEGK
jgi:hypothetical protein